MTDRRGEKTVVVGVDGMANSRDAIRLAGQEARYREAALIAVMAYSSERSLGAPAARPVSTMRTPYDQRLAAESALRDALFNALGDQAEKVEVRTEPGVEGRNLVETARQVNAQLIVLATLGGSSVLPGTVSRYVLRKATCPVLVVPENGRKI